MTNIIITGNDTAKEQVREKGMFRVGITAEGFVNKESEAPIQIVGKFDPDWKMWEVTITHGRFITDDNINDIEKYDMMGDVFKMGSTLLNNIDELANGPSKFFDKEYEEFKAARKIAIAKYEAERKAEMEKEDAEREAILAPVRDYILDQRSAEELTTRVYDMIKSGLRSRVVVKSINYNDYVRNETENDRYGYLRENSMSADRAGGGKVIFYDRSGNRISRAKFTARLLSSIVLAESTERFGTIF